MVNKRNAEGELRESLKATTLFGGTQFFSIIVSVIKNKLIALLIGPAGIGVVELFNSTIQLINTSTNFSLSISAVRDVSVAYNSGNLEQFKHTLSLFTRVTWFTGLLGTFLCLIGSPLWSKFSFGNYDYTLSFVFLSVILLLTQLNSGKVVLLQSTGNYKKIALVNIIGNLNGLITAVPIYYFLGIDGVVLVLIISSLVSFVVTRYFANKLHFEYSQLPFPVVMKEGRTFLIQGLYLSVNYIFSALSVYIIRIFISNVGNVEILGLFTSGFIVVNTYVGMVFQSLGQEYYPRLSSLSSNTEQFNSAIQNQIYLLLLILGPLVILFLIFSDYFLYLLYSEKFIGASFMMSLAMLGVVFQAPSWCMAYAFLAKGDNKAYLFWETIAKAILLTFDILFFYLWGLTGIGISFIVSYIYCFLQYSIVCKLRYNFALNDNIKILLIVYLISGLLVVVSVNKLDYIWTLLVGGSFLSISSIYSYNRLNQIINIKEIFRSKFLK